MPHLRFRGLKEEELIEISSELLETLVRLIEVPKDHFTFEYVPTTFIFEGEKNKNRYPFVEVLWFDRGPVIMKETAHKITNLIKSYNYDYVTVHFENLIKEHYFENGEHF